MLCAVDFIMGFVGQPFRACEAAHAAWLADRSPANARAFVITFRDVGVRWARFNPLCASSRACNGLRAQFEACCVALRAVFESEVPGSDASELGGLVANDPESLALLYWAGITKRAQWDACLAHGNNQRLLEALLGKVFAVAVQHSFGALTVEVVSCQGAGTSVFVTLRLQASWRLL